MLWPSWSTLRHGTEMALEAGRQQTRVYLPKIQQSVTITGLRAGRELRNTDQCRLAGINVNDSLASTYADVSTQASDEDSSSYTEDLVADIIINVARKNVHFYSVPWHTSGLDPELSAHSGYLEKLTEALLTSIKAMVDEASQVETPDWDELPPTFRKVVQEVVRESQTHLCNSRQLLRCLGVSQSLDSDYGPLLQIQQLMLADEERVRHTPIIVCGREGGGKSYAAISAVVANSLCQVLMYCPEWLGSDVVRIVRGVGQSPCCAYPAEMLRNLCLHISMVFGFEISPKHQSFELSKLSTWFQELLKRVEASTSDLVIVLDDLDRLRGPAHHQAATLGWLPWNLPLNVHLVCSVAQEAEAVLALLRSRIPAGDSYVFIPPLADAASMLQSHLKDNKRLLTRQQWDVLRQRLAGQTASPLYVTLLSQQAMRWASYEALDGELHVPADTEAFVSRSLERIERQFGLAPVKKIASYLTCTSYGLREPEVIELLSSTECDGTELAPVSWLSFKKELVDGPLPSCLHRNATTADGIEPATFRSARVLLKESYVDCRSYLQWSHRCIGTYVRQRYLSDRTEAIACHAELANAFHLGFLMQKEEKLLDWEIELLYNMTKQSVDVLSQDPQQLATEILNWLRIYADTRKFVTTAAASAIVQTFALILTQRGAESADSKPHPKTTNVSPTAPSAVDHTPLPIRTANVNFKFRTSYANDDAGRRRRGRSRSRGSSGASSRDSSATSSTYATSRRSRSLTPTARRRSAQRSHSRSRRHSPSRQAELTWADRVQGKKPPPTEHRRQSQRPHLDQYAENLGSDHFIIRTELPNASAPPRTFTLTDWDAFRTLRKNNTKEYNTVIELLTSLQEDIAKTTKTIQQNSDPHLAHLLEAKASIPRALENTTTKQTLTKTSIILNQDIAKYCTELTRLQWHELCSAVDGRMRTGGKWNLLKYMLDDCETKNNQSHAIDRLLHSHKKMGGTNSSFLEEISKRHLPLNTAQPTDYPEIECETIPELDEPFTESEIREALPTSTADQPPVLTR
ncbi:hypothetical protein HPB51_017343 [Rhipicephalus microplus]|uniref:NWD1/2-like winged helix-turn-helix domain-containing protein n=1 Tax=Rhipicephalus microplus TaxID=6941 RepID=A0A9J6EIC0_RHIMP|nr:hypothetical protein HPB51_017343 [Rhipicephalus microplus]